MERWRKYIWTTYDGTNTDQSVIVELVNDSAWSFHMRTSLNAVQELGMFIPLKMVHYGRSVVIQMGNLVMVTPPLDKVPSMSACLRYGV